MSAIPKSISLCMITLNEEEFLATALDTVKQYVDEIIIVDGGSKDRTVDVAKNVGAKVFKYEWKHDFAKQRNLSLKHATMDWVLVMDADETYEIELLENLQLFANNNIGADMFAFPRKNFIDNIQTNAYPDRQLRFFPNKNYIKYVNKVHEKAIGYSIIVSPEKMHIIHKKSAVRQNKQNTLYEKLEDKESL